MTHGSLIKDDWIDAIFRPAVGFFIGLALGYGVQLAQISSWLFALGVLVVLACLFGAVLMFDSAINRIVNVADRWLGGGVGIKPSKTKHIPHWFVRFGWIFALVLGMVAVFVLPEGALAWLS